METPLLFCQMDGLPPSAYCANDSVSIRLRDIFRPDTASKYLRSALPPPVLNPCGNDGGYSFGAALSTYTKKGNKWVFGGEYLLKNNPYKDGKIPVAQFTVEGGYDFKILSDARKIVFVYAGASALAGYESVNWGEKVLHDGSTLHDRDAFIYGGALTLDVEFYVADRIALLANLRERCLWSGDTRKFHTQFGVGIKFIIN